MNNFFLYSLSLVVLLTVSCNNGDVEPDLEQNNISNTIGNFDIDSVSSTGREILVKWGVAINAVRYDVIVNDTIKLSNIQKTTCLLTRLEPSTNYKISVRAYDNNNFTKIISKYAKTSNESLNEITALPFGRYEYQQINITNCKVTKDNNYIILGDAFIFDKTYKIVLKTDRNFNIIWKYNYEGGVFDSFDVVYQKINECNDGGFLITSPNFIFKITKDGNMEFEKKYDNKNFLMRVDNGILSYDGNLFLVGSKYMMLNKQGDTLWVKDNNFQVISDIVLNDVNNYFVYGYTQNNEKYYLYLNELDNSGNTLNEINYPVSDLNTSKYILNTKDNGYYLVSNSSFHYYGLLSEMCVTKIDNKGKELWTLHTYPIFNMSESINFARVLDDNTLLSLCYNSQSQNYYVHEISPDGKQTKAFRAGDMYVPIFVDKDENGKYTILTQGGYIYKLSSER